MVAPSCNSWLPQIGEWKANPDYCDFLHRLVLNKDGTAKFASGVGQVISLMTNGTWTSEIVKQTNTMEEGFLSVTFEEDPDAPEYFPDLEVWERCLKKIPYKMYRKPHITNGCNLPWTSQWSDHKLVFTDISPFPRYLAYHSFFYILNYHINIDHLQWKVFHGTHQDNQELKEQWDTKLNAASKPLQKSYQHRYQKESQLDREGYKEEQYGLTISPMKWSKCITLHHKGLREHFHDA